MTTNHLDLAIFDLDGTLSNTIGDIAESYRLCCTEFGFPLPPDIEVTHWVGQGHIVAVQECFNWLKCELVKDSSQFRCLAGKELSSDLDAVFAQYIEVEHSKFLKRHTELYTTIDNKYTTIFPGVVASLTELKARGVKLAVLTNKMVALTPKVLKFLQIDHFFDKTFSDGELQNNKPHPEGIFKLMEHFGVTDKSRVLMVGDSNNDVNAGLAAGVQVLGLTYGYNYGIPIVQANPTYVSGHFCACVAINAGIPLEGTEFDALVSRLEK